LHYKIFGFYSFFDKAGLHNDTNAFQHSPIFSRLVESNSPEVYYEINGHQYYKRYSLANGICPAWSTFMRTIPNPQEEKNKRFSKEQERARKDVEGEFGVVQSCWAIIQHSAITESVETMCEMMIACVIMHNMIVDDERDNRLHEQERDFQGELIKPTPRPAMFQ
jgi:hypothetical protein